ncbi:immunoglobulin-like domain-containing protein [Hydrogenimonas thermophila]|uniref:Uncharacterized conserved protein n=1 Tax=Hydrogenimonas thermophila TaxID=223786 RepID=A0A1I5LYH8_9BACT|nr:immunoglobulin-like domain-containing protein [Hydrogenimonas thermophila]SFP02217.1 Uncharacterized conserved protein [Hydrogenimonas thermophila]
MKKTFLLSIVASIVLNGCNSDSALTTTTSIATTDPITVDADTVPPVIKLLGDNPLTVIVGSDYVDPGATAIDNVDGAVGVDIYNTVDTTKEGEYSVIYTAADSNNNISKTTRTVKVVAAENDTLYNIVSSLKLVGYASEIALSSDGTKAYIADGANGLQIIDISDPTNISIINSINTSDASAIALSSDGAKAYVADGTNGLQIIDISDPANLSIIGNIDLPGNLSGIALSSDGNKAYLTNTVNGLQIIDISDPTNPSIISSIDTEHALAIALSSDGAKAYLADGANGLQIIDISDPANLSIIGSVNTNDTYAVALSSDGTKAYLADGSNLRIVDVSNAANPAIIGNINALSYITAIALSSDNIAYLADGNNLRIVDISNAANPVEIKNISMSPETPLSVTLSSDETKVFAGCANFADENGSLKIINLP